MLLSVGLPYFLSVSNLFMSVVSIKYSGTLLIGSPIGKKKFSRINEGFFFYKKMTGSFCQMAKKKWP